MTTNPAEVTLTTPGSARAQRIVAGAAIAAVVPAMVWLAFSGQQWWAIVLWELGLLVVLFGLLAIWSTAAESAKETVALRAKGTVVVAEVLDSTAHDDGEGVSHELTLWIPSGGGFEVHHRCGHYSGEQHLRVLVDPVVRTWGVVH
ncbi:hypothetical protein [Lentzea flaviverrucosa]|uniref:Uncharacterized protein n=1 Tax=Lentzea flaviverrucosa TaxID=200379 RepID=A0A1H9XXK5_9PSEU|nr:hypothetical protein [Lentzea flaviverrucosa]RDI17112.1 hypothetical protein DFR72_12275 [Lentzea flaviverrucosa]SES50816.1 hypothetical protein SAMN05216195_12254 [Lentzea flaviverrucosa]